MIASVSDAFVSSTTRPYPSERATPWAPAEAVATLVGEHPHPLDLGRLGIHALHAAATDDEHVTPSDDEGARGGRQVFGIVAGTACAGVEAVAEPRVEFGEVLPERHSGIGRRRVHDVEGDGRFAVRSCRIHRPTVPNGRSSRLDTSH